MIDQGLPSFYMTINLADVYNPVVKFLAGDNIDVDDLIMGVVMVDCVASMTCLMVITS